MTDIPTGVLAGGSAEDVVSGSGPALSGVVVLTWYAPRNGDTRRWMTHGPFADRGAAERLKRRWAGRVRIVDEDTLHVVLSPAEAAPRRLVPLLKRILGAEPERSRARGRS